MSALAAHQAGDHSASFESSRTHVSVRRYLAHFIDGLLYTVALIALILVAALVGGDLIGGTVGTVIYVAAIVLGLTVGHAWFLVILHGSSGRSPGKRAAGIRVVDAQGNVPSRAAMWKRSIPAVVEYFYIIAFLSMMASPYRQRFGDRWAETYVVADR